MEEGGQYQRLLIAIVVFVGELGAFLLLGSLSVGVILAQVLLLLLLAFAPVALVAAAIPGRGHDFFKGWLAKLAGYLLRKAAYSLILAVLLAVNGALASATSELGWLMSFGLQALFFWAVFLQRHKRSPRAWSASPPGRRTPGRDGSMRVLALYAGARTVGRPLRSLRRSGRSASSRLAGAVGGRFGAGGKAPMGPGAPAPRFGTSYSAPVGKGAPSMDRPGPTERPSTPAVEPARKAQGSPSPGRGSAEVDAKAPTRRPASRAQAGEVPTGGEAPKPGPSKVKKKARGATPAPQRPAREDKGEQPRSGGKATQRPEPGRPVPRPRPGQRQPAPEPDSGLGAELKRDRERGQARPNSHRPR